MPDRIELSSWNGCLVGDCARSYRLGKPERILGPEYRYRRHSPNRTTAQGRVWRAIQICGTLHLSDIREMTGNVPP
jgi:hypothetical protein